MKRKIILFVAFSFLLSACGVKSFDYAEYMRATGSASPGQESRVELDDGAAIVVPAHSLRQEVNITIERNPQKINNLPALGKDVVQLGDYYHFEIDGELTGPVDLVLPFDTDKIPEKRGVPVVAFPDGDSWKYVPVIPDGNQVTLYTAEIGDVLIAWHFDKARKSNDVSFYPYPGPQIECDSRIPIEIYPWEKGYTVIGVVRPIDIRYRNIIGWFSLFDLERAAYIEVKLDVNPHNWREASVGRSYTVTTDDQGIFQYNLNADDVLEGWNWVYAKAQCDRWWDSMNVESEGYAEFMVGPPSPETEEIQQITEEPMPEGAVMLPDFAGSKLKDAEDWLEENGFGSTWVDGDSSSGYDPGIIYKQSPAGGQYKVPHRTIVVLYLTAE